MFIRSRHRRALQTLFWFMGGDLKAFEAAQYLDSRIADRRGVR